MTRRLLGPIGGPLVFFLVAALVFGGLGWVTYAALGVEQAQREAAARAELGANLRVGLWRLDGRMLPALGVEDSRPFYHYAPADPDTPLGASATPLLTAILPEWMKLHFQLDAADGWDSPQVPDPTVAARIRQAWPELPLRNFYGGREQVLAGLKATCPTDTTCQVFAANDFAAHDESLPLAAPLITGEWSPPPQAEAATSPKPPAPSAPTTPTQPTAKPNGTPADPVVDAVRVLGLDVCLDNYASQGGQDPSKTHPNKSPGASRATEPDAVTAVTQPQTQLTNNRGGRAQQDPANDRGWLDLRYRAETISRGMKDAKGQYGGQYGPVLQNPALNQMNLGNNILPPGGKGDPNAVNPPPGGTGGPGGAPPGAVGGISKDSFSKEQQQTVQLKGSEEKDKEKGLAAVAGELAALGKLSPQPDRRDFDKAALDALVRVGQADTAVRSFGWFGECLSENLLRQKVADEAKKLLQSEPGPTQPAAPAAEFVGPPRPPAEPPGDRPAAPVTPHPLPAAVHLGSMRPLWVTAADGSDLLVLVRTARMDNRTVYQGVVLDWALLEAALKEEVKDLFPDARLEPVKDPAAVLPDRAMTALPVQLNPGPQPPPPPAGWTPLRIGLVLAWAAAVLAFAAVGFAGWGLIDLAERRIRFVSAVTHELRTPLTSLRLYLDLLVSGMIQDEAKRQEYLKTLTTESDRLHRLIDNVLDYAKLEKRRKDGDIRPVKVTDLLGQLRQTWTDRVAQDGKELVVISTVPPEQEVATDAGMVQQIVGNLIDNARKYAREAADHRIWVWAKPGRGRAVVLEVEDRGPGVPAGERRTIFKPFRRGDHADSTSGGAGLGLALAKSWAEVLGGRLTYRPADGGTGACFRLELPGT